LLIIAHDRAVSIAWTECRVTLINAAMQGVGILLGIPGAQHLNRAARPEKVG